MAWSVQYTLGWSDVKGETWFLARRNTAREDGLIPHIGGWLRTRVVGRQWVWDGWTDDRAGGTVPSRATRSTCRVFHPICRRAARSARRPWDQTHGGVNTVVRNLARLLSESGRDPLFLFPGKTITPPTGSRGSASRGLHEPSAAARATSAAALGARILATAPISLWHLVRLVRARKIDVVNVHYPDLNFVYFVALRWLTGVRLVTSVHGGDLTNLKSGRSRAGGWDACSPDPTSSSRRPRSSPSTCDRSIRSEERVLAISNGVDVQAVREMASSSSRPPAGTARRARTASAWPR